MKFIEANRILNEKGYYVRLSDLDGCGIEYFFYRDCQDREVYIEVELDRDTYEDIKEIPLKALGDIVVAEFEYMPFSWLGTGMSHIFEKESREIVTLGKEDIEKYFTRCIDLKDRTTWPAYYVALKEAEIKKFNFIAMVTPILEEYEFEMEEDDLLCSYYGRTPGEEVEPFTTVANHHGPRRSDAYVRFTIDLMSLEVTYQMVTDYYLNTTWPIGDLTDPDEVDKFETRFLSCIVSTPNGEISRNLDYLFDSSKDDEEPDPASIRGKSLSDSGLGWTCWK